MVPPPSLRDNLSAISARIQSSAERVKRNPREITLVAVTKAIPTGIWQEALDEDLNCIGESRVSETAEKSRFLVGPCLSRLFKIINQSRESERSGTCIM